MEEPPSTNKVCPVINPLCPDNKNAIAIAFTVTPFCASSSAQERVTLINGALAAAYAVRWVIPSTVRLEMFILEGTPCPAITPCKTTVLRDPGFCA